MSRNFIRVDHFLFSFAFVFLTGCSSSTVENLPAQKKFSQHLVDLLGGEDIVETLQNSDKVQGYLLPQESYHQNLVGKFEMRSGPVELTKAQKSKLVEILISKSSYLYDIQKGCKPDYGVRIEFRAGEKTVDFFFCFGCSQLQTYRDGKFQAGGFFDPAEKELAAMMKTIFVDDELIQSL